MQVIICVFIVLIAGGIFVYRYLKNLALKQDIDDIKFQTHEAVCEEVMRRMADVLKSSTVEARDAQEYEIIRKRKLRIEDAYTNCVFGKEKDKIIIKEIIASILTTMFPTQEDLYTVYNFDSIDLDPHWKLEILFEVLYPEYKKDTLKYLIHKYNWDKVHYDIEDGTVPSYAVDESDLDQAYNMEIYRPLTFREAISVAATLVYEDLKGFGCIDTLRTMNINGFNIGTSGSIMPNTDEVALAWKAPASVWLYFEGKYIHIRFLNMGTMEEVRRVVTLIARYNNPGPLTEKRGYLVNTMEDQSRVLALRPPAAEYWAVFVRKFTLDSHKLIDLIDPIIKDPIHGGPMRDEDGTIIHKYNNAFLPAKLVELLMRGQVTTSFTGRQGSGKTTMMTATIAAVDARFTIRVLEMAPEMYLREIYPQRNILSVQETPYVTAAELQDALKKSDAALSIVGEVATDVIAARMIQMGQVASIFTIFSHHANRAVDLINAITNSVVAASGGTATPATVEPQVIDVIKVDTHLDYDTEGNRYIERITEIIRLDSVPYPEREEGETAEEYMVRLNKEYYTRQTDRLHFTTRDVLRFDTATFTYYTCAWFTPELSKHIFERLPRDERSKWKDWVLNSWNGSYDETHLNEYQNNYEKWVKGN